MLLGPFRGIWHFSAVFLQLCEFVGGAAGMARPPLFGEKVAGKPESLLDIRQDLTHTASQEHFVSRKTKTVLNLLSASRGFHPIRLLLLFALRDCHATDMYVDFLP